VAEGKYTAYGRKLDIERGRLIFTGGPIDNPGIDLRAIKEFPDVKAGVNVRGTLLQPHMTFFLRSFAAAVADRVADPGRAARSSRLRTAPPATAARAVRRSRRAPRSSGSSSAHAWASKT